MKRIAGLGLLALLFLGLGVDVIWEAAQWWENRFDRLILQASKRYHVHPALIKAVIWQESRFRPHVVGRVGEIGLMQLTDPVAQKWAAAEGLGAIARENFFDPKTNIFAGTWYLSQTIQHYQNTDCPECYGLAEYNAGRKNVLRWATGPAATNSQAFIQNITYPGTRFYVRSVLQRRQRYVAQFPSFSLGPTSFTPSSQTAKN